jgi:hypothetical protein
MRAKAIAKLGFSREDDSLGETYVLVEEFRVLGIPRDVLQVSTGRKRAPGASQH